MNATIEQTLADFRAWLEEAMKPGDVPPVPASPPVDLATILGHYVALRQEVNLQTRAVRAQQEQTAELLAKLPPPDAGPPRELLMALAEAHDSLSLAAGPVARARQSIAEMLDAPARPPTAGTFWSRWFGSTPAPVPAPCQEPVRQALEALASGYGMSLQRIERVLAKHGLETIPTVGRPFDPEAMEALDKVAASGRPPGEVVEEVRRGYRLRGRIFRVAQVRVAGE
jgi:molecular chaperone GrpE